MAIELSSNDIVPAINRNKVFLTNLQISQTHQDTDSAPPIYYVTVEYTTYGVDEQGIRHFSGKQYEVVIPDFYNRAMSEAANGDMSMVTALQAIENAIAVIVAGELNITAKIT